VLFGLFAAFFDNLVDTSDEDFDVFALADELEVLVDGFFEGAIFGQFGLHFLGVVADLVG